MTKITIAYTLDAKQMPLALVSMASVLKNAKKSDEIEFAIMYSSDSLSEKYLQTLGNLQAIKNYNLIPLKIDENIFDGFPCPENCSAQIWFRTLLADLLPNEETVVYLDCATMARSSLNELVKTDLSDRLIGAVEDVADSKDNAERIGLDDGFYFNAGVLLLNLKLWRKIDLFSKLKDIVMTDHKILNTDDALNKVCDGLKVRLLTKYNYMYVKGNKPKPQYDEKLLKEFMKAEDNPVIVQFIDFNPNQSASKNKFIAEYDQYTRLVPALEMMQTGTETNPTAKVLSKQPWYKKLFSFAKKH